MKGLSFKQFLKILKRVLKKHRLIEGHNVKYLTITIDLRDFNVFRLVFNSYGPVETEFHTSQNVKGKQSLYAVISRWLKTGEKSNENNKARKTTRKNCHK